MAGVATHDASVLGARSPLKQSLQEEGRRTLFLSPGQEMPGRPARLGEGERESMFCPLLSITAVQPHVTHLHALALRPVLVDCYELLTHFS